MAVIRRLLSDSSRVSGRANSAGWLQAEPALVYDSVQVFAHGLAALDRSHVLRPANLSCEREEPWDDGLSLYNYINSVSTPGASLRHF